MKKKSRNADALRKLFESLDQERQTSLFDYAEFLLSRGGPVVKEIGEPLDIPKPDTETVVGAIRRMKQTYPMIDSLQVFSTASNLMTDHMVKGRELGEVINEIEALFEQTYRDMLKDFE
jgi:DNA polymerase/3'-5' exonuclease PolX